MNVKISICTIVIFIIGAGTSYLFAAETNQDAQTLLQKTQSAIDLAGEWYLNNDLPGGSFVYAYNPKEDEIISASNYLSQIQATRILLKLYHDSQNDSYLEVFKKHLAHIFMAQKESRDIDNALHLEKYSQIDLGATAAFFLIVTELEDERFDALEEDARKLGNTILFLQNDEGRFRSGYPRDTYEGISEYPGMAMEGLMNLFLKTRGFIYYGAVGKAFTFYSKSYHLNSTMIDGEQGVRYAKQNRNLAIALTPSLCQLFDYAPSEDVMQSIFIMNDFLADYLETAEGQNAQQKFTLRDLVADDTEPAMYRMQATNALLYAYGLAKDVHDTDRMDQYKKIIQTEINHILSLQYTHTDTANLPDEVTKKTLGAFRASADLPQIFLDYSNIAVETLLHFQKEFGN